MRERRLWSGGSWGEAAVPRSVNASTNSLLMGIIVVILFVMNKTRITVAVAKE
jgi:hypothetical protein